MTSPAVKAAHEDARRIVDESGDEGVLIEDVVSEVLEDHPEARDELAAKALADWLEHSLRADRRDNEVPKYGVGDEGRWKQTTLFSDEEFRVAIVRKIKSVQNDVAMIERQIEDRRSHGHEVWIQPPLLIWDDSQADTG